MKRLGMSRLAGFIAAAGWFCASQALLPAQSGGNEAGVCSRCHVVSVLEWQISGHREAAANCQTCHGPSAAHVANERNEVSPDRIPRGAAADPLCSSCHQTGCPESKSTAGCLQCHNSHSLTSPGQIQDFQGDRSNHPIQEALRQFGRLREQVKAAEDLSARHEWQAARDAFLLALEIKPGDRGVRERLAFCERRLNPAMPGFEIVGEEFDPVTGLPLEVQIEGLGIRLRLAPGGEFDIGSDAFDDSQPVHTVAIDPFYLGKFEITQAEWIALMESNPSQHKDSPNAPQRPVERISWHDAMALVAKLNEKVPGAGFRLPSEAEWEYAARAGGGLFKQFELARYAWYGETSRSAAHAEDFQTIGDFATRPAGTKESNGWGFHDMHGNVWEWTSSLFQPYFYDPSDGRESPTAAGHRVLRGGGYSDMAALLDPALRHSERPERRYRWNGLRVARSVPALPR